MLRRRTKVSDHFGGRKGHDAAAIERSIPLHVAKLHVSEYIPCRAYWSFRASMTSDRPVIRHNQAMHLVSTLHVSAEDYSVPSSSPRRSSELAG